MRIDYRYDMPALLNAADATMREVHRSNKPVSRRIDRLDRLAARLDTAARDLQYRGMDLAAPKVAAKLRAVNEQRNRLLPVQQAA